MTTITIDTLELADKLKAAGFAPEQAEAVVRVVVEAQDGLTTKTDLELALTPVKTDLTILKADSVTLKWMIGILIAGVLSIVIKTFF
ncbi:MAG: DUF1640 domain-containing protein [Methylobacter sp.]